MRTAFAAVAALSFLPSVLGGDILKTDGFTNCNTGTSSVNVKNVDISFDRSSNKLNFNVAGNSDKEQNVTATLIVSAYGINAFNKTFDPCDQTTFVSQLCPVPKGDFSADGEQDIPSDISSKIPSVAYNVPDLEGNAKMILTTKDGQQAACIESNVGNGKTLEIPAISYVAAAIAAAALALSLGSAAMTGSQPGASHSSPGFTEVMWWFQGLAMDGMYSVNYPAIYRSFTKNFAFSTGLIPWGDMQTSIDNFRRSTGGNLTQASYAYLQNATLVYPDGSTVSPTSSMAKRGLGLIIRETVTGGNSTGNSTGTDNAFVNGIQGYVEQLTIPQANTFMTVLLIFAIVIGVIVVSILLFKVILETWALWGTFPKSLATFRKEYWRVMAQTIMSLILLLYGTWTLYCIFQFTHGDSWAAKLLAGLTLGIFTALLAFYTWKIWTVARKFKKFQGDTHALYENKETWKKYRIFYENYKQSYWWLFVPFIVYMFAKGCVLAAGDGHGLFQSVGQLVIESLMLILLLWSRPYDRKSGNWINIVIQVVRVLSVACILVFVEQLGIAKTTQTITGVVLIVVQAALTLTLAILIVTNSLITCCKQNPHRKRRKAAANAMSRDLEGDAFLMEVHEAKHAKNLSDSSHGGYDQVRAEALENFGHGRDVSQDRLVSSAASMGAGSMTRGGYTSVPQQTRAEVSPPPITREPKLPDLDFGQHFRGRSH